MSSCNLLAMYEDKKTPASMMPWERRSSRNTTALLDRHTAMPKTLDRVTDRRNPRRRPSLRNTHKKKITLKSDFSQMNTKQARAQYHLPVAQWADEDVSQNPSCHEADVLKGNFPVVTAHQVPLPQKIKHAVANVVKWERFMLLLMKVGAVIWQNLDSDNEKTPKNNRMKVNWHNRRI